MRENGWDNPPDEEGRYRPPESRFLRVRVVHVQVRQGEGRPEMDP